MGKLCRHGFGCCDAQDRYCLQRMRRWERERGVRWGTLELAGLAIILGIACLAAIFGWG